MAKARLKSPKTLAEYETRRLAEEPASCDLMRCVLANDVSAWEAVFAASAQEDREVVRQFLCQPSRRPAPPLLASDTGLHRLSRAGYAPVMRQVLAAGLADLTLTNDHGQTALACAANPETVTLLLDAGLDPSQRDKHGRLPAHAWFDESPPVHLLARMLRTWWKHPRTQHLNHAQWAQDILQERWVALPATLIDMLIRKTGLPSDPHLLLEGRSPLAWMHQQQRGTIPTVRRIFGCGGTPATARAALELTPVNDTIEGMSSRWVLFLDPATHHVPWSEAIGDLYTQSPESARPLPEQWQSLHDRSRLMQCDPSHHQRLVRRWWQQAMPMAISQMFPVGFTDAQALFLVTPDPQDPDRYCPLDDRWHGWQYSLQGGPHWSLHRAVETRSHAQWDALPRPDVWLGAIIRHALCKMKPNFAMNWSNRDSWWEPSPHLMGLPGPPYSGMPNQQDGTPAALLWAVARLQEGMMPSAEGLPELHDAEWLNKSNRRWDEAFRQQWEGWVLHASTSHAQVGPARPRVRI